MDLAGVQLSHEVADLQPEVAAQELLSQRLLDHLAAQLELVHVILLVILRVQDQLLLKDHCYLGVLALVDVIYHVLGELILVLLSEAGYSILHVLGRVDDDEGVFVLLRELEQLVAREVLLEGRQEGLVGLGDGAGLVDQSEDPQLDLEQVEHLLVVLEVQLALDVLFQGLLEKDLLLVLEHVVDVELVQLLVSEVDAHLLERVLGEHLEPEDV